MDVKSNEDVLVEMFERGELVPLVKFASLSRFSTATRSRWALTGKIPSMKVAGRFLTHPRFVTEFLKTLCTTKSPATPKTEPDEAHGRDIDHISSMVKLQKRGIAKAR